jgi:hypothetical protein
MTDDEIAAALNELMRRYTEDPASFEAEFQTVQRFQQESAAGETPSYGASITAMLHRYLAEMAAATEAAA